VAKRRKTKRATKRRPKRPEPRQGWIWGLFGLGVGLSVSALIYLNDRQPEVDQPLARPAESRPPPPVAPPPQDEQPADQADRRFTFYDMLPSFEVVIPEEDLVVVPNKPLAAVDRPGIYVLQAGSFSSFDDADRRKAQLALLGIESGIQKVTVDEKVYHRIRIGPIDSLDRLNTLRSQLRGAEIDAMVIRVGE